jgi:DNA-binding GntR family transcriptional regulator
MINCIDELLKYTNFNQSKTIKEIVYEGLRKVIISGDIQVGERIVEKEYAEKLNISRTPVREALKRLEAENLVEYLPRVGAVVRRISIEDVLEVYKIRHNLEVLATTSAMDNITIEGIKEIEELLDLTEQKNMEGDVEEVIRLSAEFNLMIYKFSGMKKLAGMITRIDEYVQKFRDISISEDSRREKALKEHRSIFKAIKEKDKELIDDLIKKHLQDSLEVVIEQVKESYK